MKKVLGVLMLLVSASFGPTESASADRGFSNDDVRGAYEASFDGWAYVPVPFPTGPATRVPVASVGRFIADGNGHITNGKRTLVIDGAPLRQTFTCTYHVNSDGTGNATCVIITTGLPPSTETFDFVIIESRESAEFTGTTPGVTILGSIERQKPQSRHDD
jgi:hypothetical protein